MVGLKIGLGSPPIISIEPNVTWQAIDGSTSDVHYPKHDDDSQQGVFAEILC